MYQHQILPFGKYKKHLIHHEEEGNAFAIVPQHGACLLDIQFRGIPIIDGYRSPEELEFNRWAKNIVLFPFPNRLKKGRFNWEGKTFRFPINDSHTNNALHGFGRNKPMEVSRTGLLETSATISCQYLHNGADPAYPFPFLFTITFLMKNSGSFEIEMTFQNKGEGPLPVGLGWHPYFCLSDKVDEVFLQMPPCELIGIDEFMIPTGKRYQYDEFFKAKAIGATILDNCFALDASVEKATLELKGPKGRLRYWQETGPGKFNFLQLFTPPHRNSFAIEPMTCNIDAFNNGEGLIRLYPEQQVAARFGFQWNVERASFS